MLAAENHPHVRVEKPNGAGMYAGMFLSGFLALSFLATAFAYGCVAVSAPGVGTSLAAASVALVSGAAGAGLSWLTWTSPKRRRRDQKAMKDFLNRIGDYTGPNFAAGGEPLVGAATARAAFVVSSGAGEVAVVDGKRVRVFDTADLSVRIDPSRNPGVPEYAVVFGPDGLRHGVHIPTRNGEQVTAVLDALDKARGMGAQPKHECMVEEQAPALA